LPNQKSIEKNINIKVLNNTKYTTIMSKIYVFITVCLLATVNIATAQKKRYPMHELSVSISGGHSSLIYKLDESSHIGGFGGNVDLGYTYNVKRLFGIVTGLGISMYNSQLSMDQCSEEYMDMDDRGDDFSFKYTLTGYTEKQNIYLFTVPLMAKFSKPVGKKGWTRCYIAGGLKMGIPVVAKASINAATVTSSGYYVYEDVTYEDLPRHNFVNEQTGEQSDSDIKLNIVSMLALETGIRLRAGYQKHIMASIYLNYGLNNIQKVNNRHILEYQSNSPIFLYNSIINTRMLQKVNLLSVGIKAGISF
jgi:hypothetical protein